jgi:signal transduction histidine kinase
VEHPKWEVRKAVAEALQFSISDESKDELIILCEDVVPYVSQAATKSLREAKRITTKVYEKNDPTAERLFNLIKRINPRNVRESYAAAMQVGQIYYRELAGITAHELRTSLLYISAMLKELLSENCFKEDAHCDEYVSKVQTGIEDLLELLSRVRELSSEPQNIEIFEVVPVIEQSINEAQGNAVNSGSEFGGIHSRGLWGDTKLQGDPIQLKMALRNLIINAIEASSVDQSVSVSIQLSDKTLSIIVQDNGHGMTDQDIINAFKPFSSLKDAGRGLGVPIAQKIIHFDFGGEIRYESEVGKGTIVYVELQIYKDMEE